jgi:hypothetical protein
VSAKTCDQISELVTFAANGFVFNLSSYKVLKTSHLIRIAIWERIREIIEISWLHEKTLIYN